MTAADPDAALQTRVRGEAAEPAIAIKKSDSNGGEPTATVRGNCSSLSPAPESTPPLRSGQCLVKVTQDFLEFDALGSHLWIANIYLQMSVAADDEPGQPGAVDADDDVALFPPPAMLRIVHGDVYLTNMAFVAHRRGPRVRAIDITPQQRIYINDSIFSGFFMHNASVMSLGPGARATISNTAFKNNTAYARFVDVKAAGPVMGLYNSFDYVYTNAFKQNMSTTEQSQDISLASAVWFWDCTFSGNVARNIGQVAVESRACKVFSNTEAPLVWDHQILHQVSAWPLRLNPPPLPNSTVQAMPFTMASETSQGLPFLHPSDAPFRVLVAEQAKSLKMPAAAINALPTHTELWTYDPYVAAGVAEADSTTANIAEHPGNLEVASIVIACLVVVSAVVAIVWHRRSTNIEADTAVGLESLQRQIQLAKHTAVGSANDGVATVDTSDSWAWSDTCGISLALRQPPPPGATVRERMDFLHCQLESLGDREFLHGLVAEAGPSSRMHGGQAVIQFAKDRRNRRQYAIKFFLSSTAFADESALYTDPHTPLGPFLPALRNIVDGSAAAPLVLDARGHPLPPCIVMEKGESLDLWMQRNRNGFDIITSLQVIQHVSERLADLHAAGFVHRDLKLSNIMWLPRENRWTLIDFGCAARIGKMAPLTFSLLYAAPEVVKAAQSARNTIRAHAAMDAWSLGMIAWELFCKQAALDIFEGKNMITARILGQKPLPWEAGAEGAEQVLKKLGRFRYAVMGLLHRNSAARLTVPEFLSRCRTVIEETRGSSVSARLWSNK